MTLTSTCTKSWLTHFITGRRLMRSLCMTAQLEKWKELRPKGLVICSRQGLKELPPQDGKDLLKHQTINPEPWRGEEKTNMDPPLRDLLPPQNIIPLHITDSHPLQGKDPTLPIATSIMGEDIERKGVFLREGHERVPLWDGTNMYHTRFRDGEVNGWMGGRKEDQDSPEIQTGTKESLETTGIHMVRAKGWIQEMNESGIKTWNQSKHRDLWKEEIDKRKMSREEEKEEENIRWWDF